MNLRNFSLGIAIVGTSALLVGCGGSGSGVITTNTTRVLAGFVYAKGNNLGSGPEVVVTSSANAPEGYFAPTSGTVTLSVADGSLSRSPDSETFNMASSNAIVVTATAAPSSTVNISGANIAYNGAKTFTSYTANLGPISASGTVEVIPSPNAPSYTPGTPVALKYTVNGVTPTAPKELFIAGANDQFGPRSLACVGLDSNGVVNPAATFTLSSSAVVPAFVVTGTGPSFTVSPDSAANSAVENTDTTFTVQLVGQNITGSFIGNFSYGTVSTVTVTPGATSLLWNTAGAAATTSVSALVSNQYGAPMFNKTVNLTNPGKTSANTWVTGLGATAFTATSGATGTAGTFATTLTAPVSVVAGGGLNVTPKGTNTITATVGTTVGTATIKVIRPLNTVALAGPSSVNIGTTTPLAGAGLAYLISNGIDVDGLGVPLTDYPAITFTYTVTNTVGGTFGNVGDIGTRTTAVAAIMGGAGNGSRVVAGNVAGQYGMQVTGGVVTPSNIVTTEVVGIPAKIFLTPNTNTTSVIAGAQGNYSGIQGATVNSSFVFQDSFGHNIPNGEVTYTSIFSVDAFTGGNITSGGSNVANFTLTFGANDGLVHLTTTGGTWSPSTGGSFPFNLSKDIGHDKTP
ncbi:MAG: hypothetical protein WCI55_12325 [Armatimonadota bacterium]